MFNQMPVARIIQVSPNHGRRIPVGNLIKATALAAIAGTAAILSAVLLGRGASADADADAGREADTSAHA